ncbi:MAG: hypothetical protein J6X86_03885 [Bacteroidales bacterium]|nr:hypothetical protein [Bacteroidales bacterium]
MKLKSLIITLCACLAMNGVWAQKGKVTEFSRENLPSEMLSYLDQATSDKDKKAENAALIGKFTKVYEQLGVELQGRVTGVSNVVLKLKVRQLPDVFNFIETLNLVYNKGGDKDNFEQWIASIEYIQSRNKKIKDFTDFIEFSSLLVKDRTLSTSRSCTWQAQPGTTFRLKQEGSDINIYFDKPMELYYSSDKDNGTIYGTKGVYHYFDSKWNGDGGRLNWDRTGIPTTACWATLSRYEAVTKFPKFIADSVQFTNTAYFSKPIYGRVEEALSAKMEPEKYSFPKFRSYQKDFRMKDILPGVDYSGSFMMNGSKFITSDTKNPATLIFYRDGSPFITVNSVKFTITSNKVVSENAAVKIYIDGDSICNNGITVRYLASEKQVNLINDSKRNFYSPYSNSYHNLDMYCESIVWNMSSDKLDFSMLGQSGDQNFSTFESNSYYSERKFREIQGIDQINPVIRVYRYMKSRGMVYDFYMDEFAQAIKMDIMQAKSMIHTLARSGLVSYNEAQGRVYVNDKLVDYAKASAKSHDYDYDAIVLESSTTKKNAELDLKSYALNMHGVEKFVLSDSQQVAIYPNQGELVVRKNRDINFNGRINAGRFIFYATNATFMYSDFKLDLPQVDSMIFYVTQFNNPQEEHIVYTPLHNLTGHLQIDQNDNHSGLKKVDEQYPIFTSLKDSYVYYDRKDIHNGAYIRDKFYYTIHPFVVKNMVNFVTDSLSFNGVLTSAGIFPDITEPLKVQPDYSLGFVTRTPRGGYDAYGGKGHFTSKIDLSYRGFRAQGQVDYLTSVIQSKTIYFMPDSMVAVSDTFYVKEQGGFPDVRNGRAMQRWYPYADSMRVAQLQNGPQFKMYHNDALLAGHMVLKPGGATASGTVTIKEGTLESKLFALQPKEMRSNVTAFTLRSDKHNNIAFYATDMKSHVDYTKRRADFVANAELGRTQLPLLQYAAYVDKFSWEMDKKELDLINSKSESSQGLEGLTLRERFARKDQPGALFVSTDPTKDSLNFHAVRSTYLYDDGQLTCRQVFTVNCADAVIAPGGDTLHIRRGGAIDLMKKSQILANRDKRYHLVYDADVILDGARKYSAKGYIDYVDVDNKKQKIYLTEIAPDNRGVSIGKGFVSDSANFTLNSAFGFAGNVRVEADKEFYYFDGGVRLLHKCATSADLGLLAYASYLDPKQILVAVPEIPTDWKGNRITASILFNRADMKPHAAFLTKERAADNELMSAHGYVTFDNDSKEYMISSAEKIRDPQNVIDRYLTLNTQTCEMTAEGPIDFQVRQNHVRLFCYGMAQMGGRNEDDIELNSVLGFTFPIDEKVLGTMAQLIGDDLRLSPSQPGNEVTRHAMTYYMGAERGAEAYSNYVSTGFYDKMPSEYESTILIEGIDWEYSPVLGYHYDGVASLAMVGSKQLHLDTRIKAQLYRRGNSCNLILYIQVAADHWYYFNYEFNSQQMLIQSNVGEWVDMIKALPADKRRTSGKGDVGDYRYRISPSRTEVPNFLLRMGGNAETEDDPGDYDVDDEDVIEGDD